VITDQEKRDVEGREPQALLVWRLVVPTTPDDTAKWLDQMTNAVSDPQTSNLTWR
jgi:hypothetical protein